MRTALLSLLLCACGAAPGPAPRRPSPTELSAQVFRSDAVLGSLAAQLPGDLDLRDRALVLVGGWLPPRAERVVVLDPSGERGASFAAGVTGAERVPGESVHAEVRDGALHIALVHDVNETGYCCSGVAMPEGCGGAAVPPPPEQPDPAGPLHVTFLVVPVAVADHVSVERTITQCVRP